MFLVSLLISTLLGNAAAADRAIDPSERVLKVLSYNIHGLPSPLGSDFGQYSRIGEILAKRRAEGNAPDIVVLQEGFTKNVKQLITKAGYPFVQQGGGTSFLKMSSGLWILSEHPIEQADTVTYSDCRSFDCFANKGALHVRLRIADVDYPVDVYGTHLNATNRGDPFSTKKKAIRTRMKQIQEFAHFLAATRAQDSFVIAPGDYNLDVGDLDHTLVGFLTQLKDVSLECAGGTPCGVTSDLVQSLLGAADRHFFLPPQSHDGLAPVFLERNFDEKIDGKRLSDHRGYEVHYLLKK